MTSTNLYFFDSSLNLQKIVTSKNINAALHEQELNGLIICNIEMDMQYTKQFINDVDYVGYYVKGVYHLHHIKRVEDNHEEESVLISGRHIFFEDMMYGEYIRDVRPQNQEAGYVLRQTIEMNTRWNIVMSDTTKRLSGNHYWQSPMEVLNDIVESYGIEYEPRILFDGQRINGYQLHVANKIGEDKNIRIPFGHRVLSLKYEIDYSEVVTALNGFGKGEEVGDGYGRKINFSELEFNRNGVISRPGQHYLENPNITAIYGKDDGSPKFGKIEFPDIENRNDLLEATYEAYLEQSKPKMLFEASVADIGDVAMGDSVLIIRRERNVYFEARIHKIAVDLLYQEDMDVELGDYQHFKESKVARKTRENNNQWQRQVTSRIQQLKDQFNADFDDWVRQFREEFEQALIDALAEVEARRERMETEWQEAWNEGMEAYERDKQAAYDEAERNYNRIETEVNDAIDRNRDEVEGVIRDGIAESEQKVQDEIERKTQEVQSNLDAVTSNHAGMLADLESNVMNIDEFLGNSRSLTLDERFQSITQNFEERIRNIDSTHYNMLRGSSLDNAELYGLQNTVQVITNETDNFARLGLGASNVPFFYLKERFQIEANQTYHLVLNYRTEDVPEMDYIELRGSDLNDRLSIHEILPPDAFSLTTDGLWNKKVITFTAPITQSVQLHVGTNFNGNNTQRGILDIKKPYLTTTNNREWLPHPDDDTQNVSEIVRRVTLLEDGQSELITRSEYNFDTGNLDQYIKSVEETVEGNKQVLQRVDNWQAANGASIEETVYGFNQKVWLNDISSIGANLIPQSENAWESGGIYFESGNLTPPNQHIRTKGFIEVLPSTQYSLSDSSSYVSALLEVCVFQYSERGSYITHRIVNRGDNVVFTTWSNAKYVKVSLRAMDGFTINTDFIDRIDGRLKVKLEQGGQVTPFLNSITRIEQLADSVSIAVQEIDGTYLKQSDIQIRADYVQLGSQRLGDNQLASILRVSPNSIDAITDQLNLTGNLNVKGQIETLSLSVVEGNFARLFAAHIEVTRLDVDMVFGKNAWFEDMYTRNANIERLVVQNVFADNVNARALNVVEGNFARLFAARLNANVISTDHISGLTAEFNRLYVLNANIERLVSQSVFTRSVRALSLEAVEADIGHVRSLVLESNVILSTHVNASNAIIDKLFSENAYISRLTSKTAFIRDIQAIEITANQLNLNTLTNRINQIEGGLHIRRPDGAVWVRNGVYEFSLTMQRNQFITSNVTWTGQNYLFDSTSWQSLETIYAYRDARRLTVAFIVQLTGRSAHNSTYIDVRVREFGTDRDLSGSYKVLAPRSGTNFQNITLDLGIPDYTATQFYLEAKMSEQGSAWTNEGLVRINRAVMRG